MLKPTLTATVVATAVVLGTYGAIPLEADHTSTKINRCQTISKSGSYVLDRNLEATGDCLVVIVNFVTIDLAGYTLFGDGTGHGITNFAEGTPVFNNAVTVRNGSITNFETGILLQGKSIVVENVQAMENGNGIFIQGGGTQTIRNNIAFRNGFAGIVALGTGNSIIGNVANENGHETPGSGIGIQTDCPSTVVNNVATANAPGRDIVTIGACTRLGNSPLP